MKRAAWALAVLVALASLVFPASGSGAVPKLDDRRRYERAVTFQPWWQAFCDQHECGVPTLIEVAVTTPSDVAHMDVVVTLSLDYRTSPSDWGNVHAFFSEDDVAPATSMNPGAFPIMSPSPRHFASTTLTWVKRGVPAAGRSYTFAVDVVAKDGSGDSEATVRGTKLSVVIDMVEAGP